jgi:GST-like protein
MSAYADAALSPATTEIDSKIQYLLPSSLINRRFKAPGEEYNSGEYAPYDVKIKNTRLAGPLTLDDIGSGPLLRPADLCARWQVMMWCRQMIERLAPAAGYLGIHSGSAPDIGDDVMAAIQSEDLRGRWADWRSGKFEDEKLEDSWVKVTQAVEKCEAQLDGRDWLFIDFSLADLETYAWLAGMVDIVPAAFADAPLTAGWLARMKARPSVAQALALASNDMPEKTWAPGPEINRWG